MAAKNAKARKESMIASKSMQMRGMARALHNDEIAESAWWNMNYKPTCYLCAPLK
jgi:hypothetical protein